MGIDADENVTRRTTVIKTRRRISLAGAALTLFAAGMLLPVLGLVSMIVHAAMSDDRVFDRIGTISLISSIPLIMLGSHLMDVFERDK